MISLQLDDLSECWTFKDGEWECDNTPNITLRGFEEGSLSNGTRFFNISSFGYRYYRKMLDVDESILVPADNFVKENLGLILHNNKEYYSDLYRLDRKKAESHYKYKGVVYYLKLEGKFIPQFELSTGEFLLINLLHLFNNLLVRTNNIEKLNLILIDEIELALHPSAIKRLTLFTKEIATTYDVAIYFSTHSLEIINNLPIDNLFYLYQKDKETITYEHPCYPAYITRDIYTHNGYDVLILVEDDLARRLVYRYIEKNKLDSNKQVEVLPVGGYVNTLDLHQNFLIEEILQPVSHIVSIVDGDAKTEVLKKKQQGDSWTYIPNDTILFLPIESLEKYLKVELFDKKNYELMRVLRDKLFRFESDIEWFNGEYKQNIDKKREEEIAKGKESKDDTEYFVNGKCLFSILSSKFDSYGDSRKDFRTTICDIVVDYIDSTDFEKQLGDSLKVLFR